MHQSSISPARNRLPGRRTAPGTGVSAAVVALVAGSGLAVALAGRNRKLIRQLGEVTAQLHRVRQAEQERVHDARSAGAAIVGAVELICTGRSGADSARLRSMLRAETRRLAHTLATDVTEPVRDFNVQDLLEHAVLAAAMSGAQADIAQTVDPSLTATGRPDVTATVIANLLTNAARHAPGARVTLHARRSGHQVTIMVDDDGPGLAVADLDRLLRRGVRGAGPTAGSGLGLYTADRQMIAQSGSLLLGRGPGGGTRVALRLPAAPAVSAVSVARAS